jgi:acyl carrier protein
MQSDNSEMKSKLQRFIEDDLLSGTEKVSFEDELLMDGYVDSVGAMRLVAYIDESLGIKVPPEDFTIENFGTINVLAAYLARISHDHESR